MDLLVFVVGLCFLPQSYAVLLFLPKKSTPRCSQLKKFAVLGVNGSDFSCYLRRKRLIFAAVLCLLTMLSCREARHGGGFSAGCGSHADVVFFLSFLP